MGALVRDLATLLAVIGAVCAGVYALPRLAAKGVELLGLYLLAREEGIGLGAAQRKHIGTVVPSRQRGESTAVYGDRRVRDLERRGDVLGNVSVGYTFVDEITKHTYVDVQPVSHRRGQVLVDRRSRLSIESTRDPTLTGLAGSEYSPNPDWQPRFNVSSVVEHHRKTASTAVN